MAGELLTKPSEVAVEMKPDVAGSNVDIGKRIDVNRPKGEKRNDEIDIGKRIQPDDGQGQQERSLEPRHENVDGQELYYDDNNKVYRVNDDLLPNSVYEINGYKYTTDDQGRITSASGTLKLKEEGRAHLANCKDSMESIGKGDQKITDDRGHLIGDRFDGTNGLENMVPQDLKINRGVYRNFENELAKEVDAGKEVIVDIQPVYSESSRRPDAIVATYSIDGEVGIRIFPNGQEETK